MKTLTTTLAIFTILLLGCKRLEDPAGPALTGSIQGFVRLYDEAGKLASNHGAVQVSLGGDGLFTATDSTGKWSLEQLSAGAYDITYSKQGYGTWKNFNVQFVGGGRYFDGVRLLYQLPAFTIASFAPETTTVGSTPLILKGTITKADADVIVFIHTSGDVSPDPAHYTGAIGTSAPAGSYSFSPGISFSILERMGILSGTTIYLKAYPSSSALLLGYTDPATGRAVYPFIGQSGSNVETLVVP